jgi:hypothetical protein
MDIVLEPVEREEAAEAGAEALDILEVISRNCTRTSPFCNGQCENVLHRLGTRPFRIPYTES